MIDLSLLEDFISGAGESLDEMETALLELEISPNNSDLLHTIFRAMHTIKGAAQFVGLDKVSALSHSLEDLLDLLREGKKAVNQDIIELFIQTKDRISLLINDLAQTKSEITDVDDLITQIKSHLNDDKSPAISAQNLSDNAEENEEIDLSSFLNEETDNDNVLNDFLNDSSEELAEEELDLSSFLQDDDNADELLSAFLNNEKEPQSELSFNHESFIQDEDNLALPVEEHDQELLSIYIAQLQEKFALLNDIYLHFEQAHNKAQLLDDAQVAVESLKFSANYMGYEKLTIFYSHWLEALLNAHNHLIISNELSFDFMANYMAKLKQAIPQLENNNIVINNDSESDNKTIDLIENSAQPIEQKNNAIDDLLQNETPNLAFIEDFLNDNKTTVIAPQIEKVEIALTEQIKNESLDSIEDEALFAKLSMALNNSIEQQISEPINDVFSALLTATNEQKAKAIALEKEKNQLKIKTLDEANQEPEPVNQIVTPNLTKKTPINGDNNIAQSLDKNNITSDKALKRSIRVDADKIDSLMNQVGELIVDRAYFFQLASEINELQRYLKEVTGLGQKDLKPVRTFAYRFSEAIISLGRTSNELQEGVMKVRMLPISQLFNRYPRLVHDLAHTHNKKVQLDIRGEETELDKMIIEEISDPLIHMIRNAIGHGIETPDIRKQLGKSETGNLILEAYHESNHIVIEVTDDGRGIDTDKIKIKAQEMGLFSSDELNRMSADDLTRFIMLPGFSTAQEISNTSGRGVGMDVVKKNIEKLNGTIEVESKIGVETKIRLKIPLTLAIIQALLVRVGEDSFTIPLANVEETLRVNSHEISLLEDTEVMYLRGKTLPIFRLATLFNLNATQLNTQHNFFVVVVNTGNQKIGLMVDALLGQEEVVIKPLVDYLHEQNCFSGATIIGDGRISLILDVYELMLMATDKQVKKHQEQEKRSIALLEGNV